MTELLEQMFKKASALPPELQDVIAMEFLQEIEWENQWDNTLNKSQGLLDKLTLKAMQEYKAGRTKEMGFDEL